MISAINITKMESHWEIWVHWDHGGFNKYETSSLEGALALINVKFYSDVQASEPPANPPEYRVPIQPKFQDTWLPFFED